MIALGLIISLLLIADISSYFCTRERLRRMNAAITAINEDLVAMDTDLEEVFDHLFPEEADPETPAPARPIHVGHTEKIYDFDEENHA